MLKVPKEILEPRETRVLKARRAIRETQVLLAPKAPRAIKVTLDRRDRKVTLAQREPQVPKDRKATLEKQVLKVHRANGDLKERLVLKDRKVIPPRTSSHPSIHRREQSFLMLLMSEPYRATPSMPLEHLLEETQSSPTVSSTERLTVHRHQLTSRLRYRA